MVKAPQSGQKSSKSQNCIFASWYVHNMWTRIVEVFYILGGCGNVAIVPHLSAIPVFLILDLHVWN